MGEDHLVYVRGSGFLLPFTEQYRRFRYEDIQYIAISPSSRTAMTLLWLFGLLLFGGATAAFVVNQEGAIEVPGLIFLSLLASGGAVCFLLLLRHIILGPVCRCDLRTILVRERLAPLNRLQQANQALDLLGDVITAKQKHLVKAKAAAVEISPESLARDEALRFRMAGASFPAFLNCAFFGLVTLAALHFSHVALPAAGFALGLLGILMTLTSLVRSVRYPAPGPLRFFLSLATGAFVLFSGLVLVYLVHMAALEPAYTVGITGPFEAFTAIREVGGIAYYFVFLAAGGAMLGIGIAGLAVYARWKRRLDQFKETAETSQ